jgi:hypothetical protein
MADETVANGTNVQTIDSLAANEFALQIDGEPVTGIFRITGFFSFKLDVRTTNVLKLKQEPFKIVKMVQRDGNNVMNRWVRESIACREDIVRPKRTISIIALDDGIETRRWTVKDAWISEIGYSDFNTASGDMVEETLLIQYEDVEESWPATPNLE